MRDDILFRGKSRLLTVDAETTGEAALAALCGTMPVQNVMDRGRGC